MEKENLEKARRWFLYHENRIRVLMKETDLSVKPPDDSDPSLWKCVHWNWFIKDSHYMNKPLLQLMYDTTGKINNIKTLITFLELEPISFAVGAYLDKIRQSADELNTELDNYYSSNRIV